MTNEEAIKILKSKMDGSVDTSYEWAETVRLAIKALKQPEPCQDTISRQAAIDAVNTALFPKINTAKDAEKALRALPSAQPEPQWNNHTVACLLADLYGDTCACNYNNISEWLPDKCEVIDACPNPVGVACWEQFLKHREEQDGH